MSLEKESHSNGATDSPRRSSVVKEHISDASHPELVRKERIPEPILKIQETATARKETSPPPSFAPKAFTAPNLQTRLEVHPIGTKIGFRELASLHKRTWKNLNVEEKKVHMVLWPLALHFGLYEQKAGEEGKRPRLIGAFWARCLADAPLTLGHLYPAKLFKRLYAADVWEFGGMVIEPTFQGKGLVKMMSETARLFLFSRRPKLLITNPVEPLYEIYRQFGMKAIGNKPVEHPHAYNVKVWLMYGNFDKLAKPYFM